MDVAKSLFASRDHAGYAGRSEHSVSARYIEKYVAYQSYALYLIIFVHLSEKIRFNRRFK